MIEMIVTATCSVYEVDWDTLRARRLIGTHAPTNYQGDDGTWRTALSISELPGQGGLIFQWTDTQFTITSSIIRREPSEREDDGC